MITADLHEDVIKYIVNDITMSCRRLGIDTVFYIKDNGNDYEDLVSTSFQTMPVLFKEIHLEGKIYLEEDVDSVKVVIPIYYKYKTFGNGENGHSLDTVIYYIDKGYTSKNIRDISKYISKVKGLTI